MNVRLASARAGACWVAVASVGLLAACSSSTPDASSAEPTSGAASSAAAPSTSAAAPASSAAAPSADGNVVNPGADPMPVLAGGTGDISGPGVTATEIKIGQIATETGPMPGAFQGSIFALQAFANYINDQGGILGRQLVIDQQDDAFDCATYTNAMKAMSEDVFAMVGTWSNQDGCGQEFLEANPQFANIQGYILNPALYEVPNAFSGLTAPPGQRNGGYLWVKDQFPDAMSKGAYLYSTYVPTTGDSVKKAGESAGVTWVYNRGIGFTETSYTADILRMKGDGVRLVDLTGMNWDTTAAFFKQAAEQDFKPDVILAPTGYDPRFFEAVGDPAATSNFFAALPFAMFTGEDRASVPMLDVYLTELAKVSPEAQADLYGATTWAAAVMFAQALQAAGPTVTQASLVEAVQGLGEFSAAGMMAPSLAGEHQGSGCVVMVGTKDGQFVRLDPADAGFECSGEYVPFP